jgi:hypothetical protein
VNYGNDSPIEPEAVTGTIQFAVLGFHLATYALSQMLCWNCPFLEDKCCHCRTPFLTALRFLLHYLFNCSDPVPSPAPARDRYGQQQKGLPVPWHGHVLALAITMPPGCAYG